MTKSKYVLIALALVCVILTHHQRLLARREARRAGWC